MNNGHWSSSRRVLQLGGTRVQTIDGLRHVATHCRLLLLHVDLDRLSNVKTYLFKVRCWYIVRRLVYYATYVYN